MPDVDLFIYNMDLNNSDQLNSFLINCKEPVVLKNVLKWNLLNWTLDDWKIALQNETLQFRSGLNKPTRKNQWERKTRVIEGDFDYFLNKAASNDSEWYYFDYKHLNNWFKNNESLRQEINWSPLGFPDIKPEECTIWIGSKGAHTPCHLDSYGFNLVHQIFGKKLWLLFPPEENLKPTRLPYEESSVYSKLNFFNPDVKDFKGLENKCRKVILHPGDVLIVPSKWWHYVENMETSITINVWLPSVLDDVERLKESIVQLFVKQMTMIRKNEVNDILNPNMDEIILGNSPNSFLETVNKCKNKCAEKYQMKKMKVECTENEDFEYKMPEDSFRAVPILTREEFVTFLEGQNGRFGTVEDFVEDCQKSDECVELIESFTNPEVINLITNILLTNK